MDIVFFLNFDFYKSFRKSRKQCLDINKQNILRKKRLSSKSVLELYIWGQKAWDPSRTDLSLGVPAVDEAAGPELGEALAAYRADHLHGGGGHQVAGTPLPLTTLLRWRNSLVMTNTYNM